ncbi:regulator of sigma E protease [Runella defluvii]|uniref:Zinc metalloprotease n=1 Tax=Runella defluvii TaxID=370973 RepID=A0A7W5ZRT7_9BACT|nr:RIP metalloprotease RseP [Runella defluvii]MBB3841731.1 regulator of sigma E protease [Runella defluvii]
MEILVMVGQLILGLSILVGLHEWGHLITAKMFGMRVEKYFIGFPPKIWSIQRGETEYGFGAVPLGGFVKISGMVDESLDTKNLTAEPEPWEFRAKPAWQRLIVMLGGIIVNVITGIIIFVAITYSEGYDYIATKDVKYGIVAHKLGQEIGLRTGDKIVAINGKPFDDFAEVRKVFLESNSYYTVERNGEKVDIYVPNNFIEKISDKKNAGEFIDPIYPFSIREVTPGMPASKSGLLAGDKIVKVNNQPIQFYHEIRDALSNLKNKKAVLEIDRKGKVVTLNVDVPEDGKIGFYPELGLTTTHIDYSFGESIAIGTQKAFSVVTDNIRGFGKIFRGEVSASKALSGPIGIAQMFGGIWDWGRFWFLTGLLSMVLAFMNILPIPALDGGHSVLLIYEMVTGHKPSDKFLEAAQKVGMVILLGLMVFAFGNDIFKLFR